MSKPKKVTWKVIHDEFKKNHPQFYENVFDWRPYNYASIVLYLKDKSKWIYDYDQKKAYRLSD